MLLLMVPQVVGVMEVVVVLRGGVAVSIIV